MAKELKRITTCLLYARRKPFLFIRKFCWRRLVWEERNCNRYKKYLKSKILVCFNGKSIHNKKPKLKQRIYKDGHELYIVAIYSVYIEKLFRDLLGNPLKNKSKNFIVPTFKNKNVLRTFIRGLFEAEAYSYLWYNQLRVSFEIFNKDASGIIFNNLIEDGIVCSLSHIRKGGCRIDITGSKNTSKFYELYHVTFHRE